MTATGGEAAEGFSERQTAVLDAALALLVEAGEGLTMTGVARRANCSKETLYKWFGGRDGLLTATVQWQASKVRAVDLGRETLNAATLAARLERFASDWLTVLSGSTSVALNRLAVGQAGTDRRDLGAIVLENGPVALRRRLTPVLEIARERGLLRFEDSEAAFRTFFGLVVRDLQIRLLLGDLATPGAAEIRRDARRASEQFIALYGAGETQPEPAAAINRRM